MDDQSADLTTAAAPADAPISTADPVPASSALTDDHHDWTSAFTGIATRGASSDASATASASSDDTSGGGFFSGIANAVSDAASGVISTAKNVANDVGHTVSDAASGVVNTVETVASDVGHTVSDAASGVVDTAGKVASDIGSGNFGDALGDAASGVVATTGHVVSDVAHTAVDAGSGLLSTAGKIVTDTEQTITDAATGAISTAGKVVGDTAQAVAQAAGPDSMLGQAAGAVGNFSTSAASGLVDTVNTVNDFNKGVVEGVVGGVEGLAKGVVSLGDSVGQEAFALATDEKAREHAAQTVLHGAEAVGNFAETAVTDPSKALGQVEDAAGGAVDTVENMASNVYKGYQAAAAQGHGAEFIGKGVGQGAVLVAGAVLTDGASLAGEGAAVAGEGAALLSEGAALAGEGATVAGEGAALAGEGAAVVGEGAAAAGEGAGAVGEGAAAGEGADAAGEALSNTAGVTPEGDGALSNVSGDAPPPSEPPPSEPGGGDEPPSLTPDQQRQADILEEFGERQQQYGGQQTEIADEPPSPDLDEPNRMQELDSGHDPTWQREGADERVAQGKRENPFTPADNRGAWQSGNPGDGRWAPNNPGEYGLEEGQTIPFKEGTPDFTEYATETEAGHPGTVEVDGLTGDSAADREATIQALADREGVDYEQMQQWLTDNRQRLHHFGGNEMQIVPEKLHSIFHAGGASELRAANAGREMAEEAAQATSVLEAESPGAAQAGEEFRNAEDAREADLAIETTTPSRR
jgi:hypothetical protein